MVFNESPSNCLRDFRELPSRMSRSVSSTNEGRAREKLLNQNISCITFALLFPKIARNCSSFHDFLIKPKMMEKFFREMKIFTLKFFFSLLASENKFHLR